MKTVPNAFAASRVAAWLGVSRQAVLKRLRTVPRTGTVLVNGRQMDGWTVDKLPADLLEELRAVCSREKFGSVSQMLDARPRAYAPPIPAEEIAEHCWEHARKLKLAMGPSIARMHHLGFTGAEFERLGVLDYAEQFGCEVSVRHWRALFGRVVDRDAGREEWDNLAIYLPDRLARRGAAPVGEPAPDENDLDEIVLRMAGCVDPGAPNEAERADLWAVILDHYDRLTKGRGESPRRAKRMICDFIAARAPVLAPTRDALRKAFDRALADREARPGDAKALRDQRRNNTGNHDGWQMPEEDRDLLIARAVFRYRGDILPAWQELIRGGAHEGHKFSAPIIARYAGKARGHYHMPASVRADVTPEVQICTVLHQGKKAFDQVKGYVRRSYEGIHSLRCFQADDVTFPVYWHVPDGNGWFTLVRGQMLLMIDFRSLCVLGFSLQPDRNYSSLTMRPLHTHVFQEYGVPEILYHERGAWKTSSLLKGRQGLNGFGEISQGLREFGIKFIHAIRARSKTVERVIGRLQDLSEGVVGYCGRDERRDCPEATTRLKLTVERWGRLRAEERAQYHPAQLGLLSFDEMTDRLEGIIEAYNSLPQGGRILDGLSPSEALDKLRDHQNPPIQFDAGIRCLFATQKEVKRVTLNGVTYRVGKNVFNYLGEELTHMVGREVLLWFDPEHPETAVVTDLDRRNPIAVNRSQEPNALEALVDPGSGRLAGELSRIEGQAAYLKARFRVIKRKFAMTPRRFHSPEGESVAAQINERTEATKAGQRQHRKAQQHARAVGLPLPASRPTSPEAVDDLADLDDFMNGGD